MRSLLFVALFGACGSAFALSCGDTVVRDTRLTEDLVCTNAPAALVVARSGVTIDLNGHAIVGGDRTTAIELEDVRHATVRNGRIEGAGIGVEATRSGGLTVRNVDFVNVGDGVRLHNSSRAEIANNRFAGVEGHAIAVLALPYSLTRGGRHAIHGNTIVDAEYGVTLHGRDSGGSRVASNRFERVGTFAIQSADADSDVEDNAFDDSGVADIVD